MTVLLGIFSSFIASLVFAFFMFGIRPRLKIVDKICITKENDKTVYRIKVINKTKSDVINLSYTLLYCITGQDDVVEVVSISPIKTPLTSIRKKEKNKSDHAIRISYCIDEGKYNLDEGNYFLFCIQATHPFSNAVKSESLEFKKASLVRNCGFQTGDSTDIIQFPTQNSESLCV